jgi:hypothetical protein
MTSKIENNMDRFTQGYACACAVIAQVRGQSVAQSILSEGGFTEESLLEDGVEDYDMELIFGPKQQVFEWEKASYDF